MMIWDLTSDCTFLGTRWSASRQSLVRLIQGLQNIVDPTNHNKGLAFFSLQASLSQAWSPMSLRACFVARHSDYPRAMILSRAGIFFE